MKKLLLLGFLFFGASTFAQNSQGKMDDAGRISLVSYIPDQIEGMPSAARNNLKNKLNQITMKNGIGGTSISSRFIITANISVLTKDITASAPPMHAYTLALNLYIGDGVDGTLFATTSLTLKGAGQTETKAYISALKRINANNPELKSFVEKGKKKIIEYYNTKCDFILKQAETLASANKYNAAIATLISVPEVCKDCYNKAMEAVGPMYQKKIDFDCKTNLQLAKNAWSGHQNSEGADAAAFYLAKIDPMSSCFGEVQRFTNTIRNTIRKDREWNFKLKKQQDDVDIEKARIRAARDVGVAYGENQPDVVYNISGWW